MSGLRPYDILVIADARPTEEEVAELQGRLRESATGLGAEVTAIEDWGRRRLTFEIRKQREGSYFLMQVKAPPPVVREFERQLKLNEAILRFMTTRVVERRPRGKRRAPEPTAEATAEGVA